MSSRTPKVSVIVPVYNQERFVGRCLRSLLHQTIPHEYYEILVIDDGSTDRTAYALDLFRDPTESIVKVIANEENLGLPASVNRGIRASSADYVVRVDSDDYVNSNFINFLSFYLDNNLHADAVACDYLLIDDEENVLERANCLEQPIACGIMFRKAHLFDIGLYDEAFRCHEERELRIRFERKYSISRLELPLYRYRRHDKNITNDLRAMEYHRQNLLRKHGAENTSPRTTNSCRDDKE